MMNLKPHNLFRLLVVSTFVGGLGVSHGARAVAQEEWTSYFQLNPLVGYTQAHIFGQGSVPSYSGMTYGGELAYLVGTPAFSVAPFLAYKQSYLKNSANSPLQNESLKGSQLNYGLLATSHAMYLKAGLAQLRVNNEARGEINNSKKLQSLGVELGAGVTHRFSKMVWASVGLDINNFAFKPEDNPILNRLDYISYTLVFTLNIGVPSGPRVSLTRPQPGGRSSSLNPGR